MSRPNPPHSRELKLEAVRRVLESGLPQNQVARELGLSPNTLSRWKRQYQAEQKEAFPGKGRQTSQAVLASRLRRENERGAHVLPDGRWLCRRRRICEQPEHVCAGPDPG